MSLFTDNPAPATVLETIAARLKDEAFPVRIRNQDDHAALAATVLWSFAKMTGLDNENERFQTVLTDFLANLLHLCEQCDAEGAGEALLRSALQTALLHFEQEGRGGKTW
jgi:hypothetical protein